MKKKFKKLSIWSFAAAMVIFVFSYFLYHYLTPAGFTSVWNPTPGKPLVTLLFAIWGVMFLFASVMSLFVAYIFFNDEE